MGGSALKAASPSSCRLALTCFPSFAFRAQIFDIVSGQILQPGRKSAFSLMMEEEEAKKGAGSGR